MIPDIRVGQPYSFIPTSCPGSFTRTREDEHRRLTGRVVYVHPKGRYFLVEAETSRGQVIRECFQMTGGPDNRTLLSPSNSEQSASNSEKEKNKTCTKMRTVI